jgi:hypothetical protein
LVDSLVLCLYLPECSLLWFTLILLFLWWSRPTKTLLPPQTFGLFFAAYQGAWTVMTEDSAKLNIIKAIRIRSLKRKSWRTRRLGLALLFPCFTICKILSFKTQMGRPRIRRVGRFCAENFLSSGLLRNQLPDHILKHANGKRRKGSEAERLRRRIDMPRRRPIRISNGRLSTGYQLLALQAEEDQF